MAIFSIISKALMQGLDERITRHYPQSQRWSDTCWFVETDDNILAVSANIGVPVVRDEQQTLFSEYGHVMVVQVSANYWGYGTMPFWDWMKSAFERSGQ